jgi:hypothetical protein
MCPQLQMLAIQPARSANPEVLGLPSDADLSHLTDEQLAKITGRPLSSPGKPQPASRRKKARKESGPTVQEGPARAP